MVLAVEKHVPPYAYEYVWFDGRLDVEKLIGAVDTVAAIVPESLCRFDSRRMRFGEAGFTAQDVVTECQQEPTCGRTWDIRGGPQVRIDVSHGPSGDSMIVGVSHVLADGAGLEQYVSLLADAYNGTLPNLSNNRSVVPIVAIAHLGPATKDEKWDRHIPSMCLPLPSTGQEHFCPHVTVPASIMKPLYDLAKSRSVTLNDVFLTACGRIVASMLGVNIVPLQCPVNLRPFIDAGPLTVANMTGVYRVVMDMDPDDSFSATLEQVHRKIAVQREQGRHFFNIPSLEKATRRFPAGILRRSIERSYQVRPVEYTNLGVLAPIAFSGVNATSAFITGAYGRYPEFPLSISTFSGATTFATTLEGDQARAEAGEKTLRRVIQECTDWLAEEGGPDCPPELS